jgi:hypothetical protein
MNGAGRRGEGDAMSNWHWLFHQWGKWEIIKVIQKQMDVTGHVHEMKVDKQMRECQICGRKQFSSIHD